MPSDHAAVDRALIARLTDAELQALMPGGPYFDLGAHGQTGMTIVSVHEDAGSEQFGGVAARRTVYQAKAVDLNTSAVKAEQAAARIHALLQWDDGPAPLAIAGFDLMALRLTERIRYTEVDAVNDDLRWQHQGGLYEIIVSPAPGASVAAATVNASPEEHAYGATTRQ
jgi:hypothetical protein